VTELDVFGGETWCCSRSPFSSIITPSLQGTQIYFGFRFPNVWAGFSKKSSVSQFGLGGGGVTELDVVGREMWWCRRSLNFFHNHPKPLQQPNFPWVSVFNYISRVVQEDQSVVVPVCWRVDRIRCFWWRNMVLWWGEPHFLPQSLQARKPAHYTLGFSFVSI
jgi:hypothetical protein